MKYLTVLIACCMTHIAMAETVFVTTQLDNLQGAPNLIIFTRGLDNSIITPSITPLIDRIQSIPLPTHAHVYEFTDIEIQYPNKQLIPCVYSKEPIVQKDTYIRLSGILAEDGKGLSCTIHYATSIVMQPPVVTQSNNDEKTPAAKKAKKDKAGVHFSYPGISRYLRHLQNCEPGFFTDLDPTTNRPIQYRITGLQKNVCQVQITVPDQQKTLNCQFDEKTVAKLASKANIDGYNTGGIANNQAVNQFNEKNCTGVGS